MSHNIPDFIDLQIRQQDTFREKTNSLNSLEPLYEILQLELAAFLSHTISIHLPSNDSIEVSIKLKEDDNFSIFNHLHEAIEAYATEYHPKWVLEFRDREYSPGKEINLINEDFKTLLTLHLDLPTTGTTYCKVERLTEPASYNRVKWKVICD